MLKFRVIISNTNGELLPGIHEKEGEGVVVSAETDPQQALDKLIDALDEDQMEVKYVTTMTEVSDEEMEDEDLQHMIAHAERVGQCLLLVGKPTTKIPTLH